jgi:CRISPR-associated protein Cas2
MIHLLIVYDIVNDKNRKIVGDLLEEYGTRVNRSVFECSVKNKTTLSKLQKALEKEIDLKVDSLRMYPICANCMEKAWVAGNEPEAFRKDAIYFF